MAEHGLSRDNCLFSTFPPEAMQRRVQSQLYSISFLYICTDCVSISIVFRQLELMREARTVPDRIVSCLSIGIVFVHVDFLIGLA